jgi:hypothetical protein
MHLARYTGARRRCAYHDAVLDSAVSLEQQIEVLERPAGEKTPRWPWLLVLAGLLLMSALGVQAYSAYAAIAGIDRTAKIATPNPVVLFQDVATNGPRVGSTVEASSRATYTRALEQFVLDGTGLILGFVLGVAGLFARANL